MALSDLVSVEQRRALSLVDFLAASTDATAGTHCHWLASTCCPGVVRARSERL